MLKLLAIFLLIFTGCTQAGINANSQKAPEPQTLSDAPQKITLCQLKNDPAAYNYKLVEVSGLISFGLEDAGISDSDCSSEQPIWVEYGGTSALGTMYCCEVSPARKRKEPLVVENIKTSLVEDAQFQKLDELLHKQNSSTVRANVIGRFFSGKKSDPSREGWRGYGHMGCCSLLIIQKVFSVEPQNHTFSRQNLSEVE